MSYRNRKFTSDMMRYFILIVVGLGMTYPLLWMFFSTFKSTAEIFGNPSLLPKVWTLDGYRDLFRTYGGQLNLPRAMANTMTITVIKVIFTALSVTIAAYGFARFQFVGKKILFPLMISTLFLPQTVLNAPQYIMYKNWGWLDSYLPLIVPSLFAADTFFVFMVIQFLRGIPREMEQAASIDGCNSLQSLLYIIVPILKPAIISAALFQFMWTSNDFMGPLIYVTTVSRRPVSIFIKMCMDADAGTAWNRILAFSLIALLPSLILFFIAQKSFVEGVSAGSLKG